MFKYLHTLSGTPPIHVLFQYCNSPSFTTKELGNLLFSRPKRVTGSVYNIGCMTPYFKFMSLSLIFRKRFDDLLYNAAPNEGLEVLKISCHKQYIYMFKFYNRPNPKKFIERKIVFTISLGSKMAC